MNRRALPANAVYERTHAGLTGLLSGRAARRVLDAALTAERRTPQGVNAAEMTQLLLGPVLRDLSGVLPTKGLRRELRRLARSLRTLEQQAEPEPALPLIEASDIITPRPSQRSPPGEATALAAALPSDPDRVLPALAVLEGVAGVAVFTATGGATSVRGDLPDAAGLGRVIAAAGALLGRHGALRSVCITTSHGMLVAVPVPPLWLALMGERDMNLGAVYAALAALEEER